MIFDEIHVEQEAERKEDIGAKGKVKDSVNEEEMECEIGTWDVGEYLSIPDDINWKALMEESKNHYKKKGKKGANPLFEQVRKIHQESVESFVCETSCQCIYNDVSNSTCEWCSSHLWDNWG